MKPHWRNSDGEPVCERHAPDVEGDLNSNETDVPENCIVCGRPCEYTLTTDGVAYVLEQVRDALQKPVRARNKVIHDRSSYYDGSRHVEIVRDWASDLKWYSLSKVDSDLIDHFLAVTEEK